ncbi:MAG: HD-GYP domain-containing protein [Candidatus Thiodiazotropha sp. (ex Dulcina madagascariensis)]|nr:HD-GYP domain-containing protein [Candidatus Thiodiazotropha sp. (ex Dulcina madagascariensis)]
MTEDSDIQNHQRRLSLLESHIGFKLETFLQHALKARDSYTQEHSDRVVALAEVMGNRLKLEDHDMDVLSLAAGFHDIGKLGIPDHILLKPDDLSGEEYEGIKKHPVIGASMLRSLGDPLLDEVAVCVLHHHEHWDGTGYPDGLKGEQIPIISRIIAVVDAFDAMTTTRNYRKPIERNTALEMIKSEREKQFCPDAVQTLLEVCRDRIPPYRR